MRDHTKLRAFVLADEVAVGTYELTRGYPSDEKFGLVSQMRRAAVSVPSNIVEGCARDSQTEYVRFLNIAFGSLRELRYQIELSIKLGFAQSEPTSNFQNKVVETEKVLNALIRSLSKSSRQPQVLQPSA